MATPVGAAHIDAVRRFNRFYTTKVGVLPHGHLESRYSLIEVRVLYELAHRELATATEIAGDLQVDLGYMSRIVNRFENAGLISRRRSSDDGRQRRLTLTAAGKRVFRDLNQRASANVAGLLSPLSTDQRVLVTGAMKTIESALVDDRTARTAESVQLRAPNPGDLGWVVQRHGEIYAAEYAWDNEFEGLVARIVAEFVENFDPAKERCWIAERRGERAGCVFLVRKSAKIAKLRLLLVEPDARGSGLGSQLVTECINFARAAGYRKVALWTNSVLGAARRIYERAGFRVIETERHHSFGHDLVAETWELEL
jgi:DNA-binding MarR family transcriptional regulator/GNAT superfamily N-acetyltransferase